MSAWINSLKTALLSTVTTTHVHELVQVPWPVQDSPLTYLREGKPSACESQSDHARVFA